MNKITRPTCTKSATRNGQQRVLRGFLQLTTEERTLLILKHLQNYSYEELGHALQISRATVKSRLFRARRNLALQLTVSAD